MKRCLNCGNTSGIKDRDAHCRACGGNTFEHVTNTKEKDIGGRVKALEDKVTMLSFQLAELAAVRENDSNAKTKDLCDEIISLLVDKLRRDGE